MASRRKFLSFKLRNLACCALTTQHIYLLWVGMPIASIYNLGAHVYLSSSCLDHIILYVPKSGLGVLYGFYGSRGGVSLHTTLSMEAKPNA